MGLTAPPHDDPAQPDLEHDGPAERYFRDGLQVRQRLDVVRLKRNPR